MGVEEGGVQPELGEQLVVADGGPQEDADLEVPTHGHAVGVEVDVVVAAGALDGLRGELPNVNLNDVLSRFR